MFRVPCSAFSFIVDVSVRHDFFEPVPVEQWLGTPLQGFHELERRRIRAEHEVS